MYTDDDEIGRAVLPIWRNAGRARAGTESASPTGWDRIRPHGMEPKRTLPTTFAVPTGMPARSICPTEISVIDQAVEKVWQGEGWYRVTGGDGEKWEPDFYVTRECLVAALRDAYDEASFSGAICVPRVEPAPDPNRRRTHAF